MSETAIVLVSSTDVYDLRQSAFQPKANYSLPPREAVRNAYAQFEKGDYNTWDYAKYDHLVEEGLVTVRCGDFSAWK